MFIIHKSFFIWNLNKKGFVKGICLCLTVAQYLGKMLLLVSLSNIWWQLAANYGQHIFI